MLLREMKTFRHLFVYDLAIIMAIGSLGICANAQDNAQYTAPVQNTTDTDTLTILGRAIDEIAVTAPRVQQATATHSNIGREELQRENIGQNLPLLLSTIPALLVTTDDGLGVGYTYFRIRGTDHTRINMTVNDVPLNDAESQTVFWVNMTDMASSISSVDVQRGVGTSTNGVSSFGASLNMLTRQDQRSHVDLAFNGGMYNTFREMLSAHVILPSNMRVNARFSKVNSNGFLYRAKSDLYSYYADFGYEGEHSSLFARFFGGKETTGMGWDGVDKNTAYGLNGADRRYNPAGEYTDAEGNTCYYANQTDNYAQQHAQIEFNHRFNANWRLSATAHYTHGGGYYEQYENKALKYFGLLPYTDNAGNKVKKTDGIYRKQLDNHYAGALLTAKYTSDILQAQMGIAGSHYIGHHFGNLLWVSVSLYTMQLPYDHEYYRSVSHKTDANIFAKVNWDIIHRAQQRLSLYGDLQYRYIRYHMSGTNADALKEYADMPEMTTLPLLVQHHFFNPKAGLTYRHGGHMLYASFAIANRDPSRDNYTENVLYNSATGTYSGTMPKAETLFDYELGYTYSHPRFSVGANLYMMDYDNQLVLTGRINDVGKQSTMNVKDSYRMGIELTLGVRIADWMRWDANCVLSRNKILNYTETITRYDADYNWLGEEQVVFPETTIAFSPSVTAMSLFTFTAGGFTGTVQTQVVGKQYLDNTQNETATLRAYSTTNINLRYNLPIRQWVTEKKEREAKGYVPDLTLLCQINNVFNAKYASNGGSDCSYFTDGTACWPWYYAQAGINVHAGFVINF